MKRIKYIFAWMLVAVGTTNLLFTLAFRINRYLGQYSWWIKRGHTDYLGREQSLFALISSVFVDYLFVLPFMVIALLVSIGMIRKGQSYKGIKKGMLFGLLISGTLSSSFIALAMIPRYHEILHDGTAEWAMAWLPFIWIGYPALIVGALLGLLVALAHRIYVRHRNLTSAA